MRWVTDPVTGDTAVHVAAAAGNIEGFKVIARSFGRDWRPNEWYMTCIKAIFFLRNKAGDTVFHIAARAGRLGVVNAAWYWFLCLPQMNQLPDESGSDVYVPVDEDMPEPEDVNPLYIPECMMAIVLLARKNFAGRTPADEAITAGHDNVAEWLRLVLDRLTLNGRRVIEGRMARMEELVDGRYDIDGHHIKPHQIPAIKRLYMRIDPNGSVTWTDDAGREVAIDDDGNPILGFCTY
ncbi:uncharacterized protein CTRU02_214609 [Colletotrichum truncatum]|uniref:Uncharacterized protein n=1 Tax=Colletotrichum truncatum TaxID=5467 RepID=A0ACC3YF67_COLTU|nr:uncharacterized protein CTRU02_09557 [Colletotrichum truncatum]KAF6788239.1 hypothetical protein CTRU02_09557 [Colletotrichum truncatum]